MKQQSPSRGLGSGYIKHYHLGTILLLTEGVGIFSTRNARQEREQAALETQLYEQIGRLKMELEWLKKGDGVRTQDLSLLAARPENHPSESGLEFRHHLHSDAARFYVR